MTEKRTVTCDGCGTDLTYTGFSGQTRLALVPESVPHHGGGAVMGGYFGTSIEKPLHFCDTPCLRIWLDRPSGEDG